MTRQLRYDLNQTPYDYVTRVYAPRFFVSSQQKFGVTDIKAPWRATALGGQTALWLLNKPVLQLSVTALFI